MSVKLQTKHLLEFLSLTGCFTGSYESTLVKMSNCWKSHAAALIISVTANINEMALLSTSSYTQYIDWPCGSRVEKQVRITFNFNGNFALVNVYVDLVVFTRIAGTS